MAYKITNLTAESLNVEGTLLQGTGSFTYVDALTSAIESLHTQGKIGITSITISSEVVTVTSSPTNVSTPMKHGLPSNAVGRATTSTPVVVILANAFMPKNIYVRPDSGASVRVEFSEDGNVTYVSWPLGDVSANTSDIRYDPVSSIRFTLLSGTGFYYGVE